MTRSRDREGTLRRNRSVTERPFIVAASFVALSFVGFASATAHAQTSTGIPPQGVARATIDRYCVNCHNQKLKTAGLALDQADISHVAQDGAVWEKVIRKLRAGAMPPPGVPRPDEATYDRLASYLETELDQAAATHLNPGRVGVFHRLSRTEYKNAVRDLLVLEALPKELDISTLLPADNSSSGFDNLADLLFVSPTVLEGYLSAARKISRLAVGDPSIPVIVNRYLLPA